MTIETGDSLWILAPDEPERWLAHRVIAQSAAIGGTCGVGGPVLMDSALHSPRTVLSIADTSLAGALGMPARVTRPVRYSGYRASDGFWYLGEKEWNGLLSRFNAIQPAAGPFLSASLPGVGFVYRDSAGNVLPAPVADPAAIALVRLELRAETRGAVMALGSSVGGKRRDSLLVAVALRNRR
jgi:hypothetical protein